MTMGGLLRVAFFDDELFWSFLSRTARANGSVSLRAFCSDLALDYNGMLRGDDGAFAATAALLGHDREALRARSTSPAGPSSVAFDGEVYHDGMLSCTPRRYCPDCIDDDDGQAGRMPISRRYGRVAWAFQCMHACVRHGQRLLPIETTIPWRRHDVSRILDQVSLTGSRSAMVATNFEAFVLDRLSGTVAHGPPLDSLALSGCIELCENVGRASMYGRSYAYKKLDGAGIRAALETGFVLLSSERSRLVALLDDLARLVPVHRANSGEAIYGPLYGVLARRPSLYKTVVPVFWDHAFSRFPRLSPGVFFGNNPERAPLKSVARSTSVSAGGLIRYLYQHGHLSSKRIATERATMSVELASAAIVALRGAITFEEAAAILGCSKYELRGLVLSGVIKPLVGFPDKTGAFKRTDLYIDRQVASVCEKVAARVGAWSPGLVPFRQAVRRLGCEPSEVLKHIMVGELSKLSLDVGKPLFRALKVDEADIADVLGLDGTMGAATARRALRVDHLTLTWLVESSALGGTIDFRTGAITVRQKDITAFRRDYMTMGELAARRGQSLQVAREVSQAAGLIAVFPATRARDDIFYRTDVVRSGLASGELDHDQPGIPWTSLMNAAGVSRRRFSGHRGRSYVGRARQAAPLSVFVGVR